jgi:hypothetical protein
MDSLGAILRSPPACLEDNGSFADYSPSSSNVEPFKATVKVHASELVAQLP